MNTVYQGVLCSGQHKELEFLLQSSSCIFSASKL